MRIGKSVYQHHGVALAVFILLASLLSVGSGKSLAEGIEVQAVAAVASAIAAGFAAYTAFVGPIRAAHLAEELRLQSDEIARRYDAKDKVFRELMSGRHRIKSDGTLSALNVASVAYSDSEPVRAALRNFYEVLNSGAYANPAFIALVKEMSRELKQGGIIQDADVENVFS